MCYSHVGVVSLADGDAADDVGRLDPGLSQVLGHQVTAHREPDAQDPRVLVPAQIGQHSSHVGEGSLTFF